jgi:hypothetical protein
MPFLKSSFMRTGNLIPVNMVKIFMDAAGYCQFFSE